MTTLPCPPRDFNIPSVQYALIDMSPWILNPEVLCCGCFVYVAVDLCSNIIRTTLL